MSRRKRRRDAEKISATDVPSAVSDREDPNASEEQNHLRPGETQKYTIFYKFSQITLVRAVSRLKVMQTGFVVVMVPFSGYLYYIGTASELQFCFAVGLGTFASIMLYVMNYMSTRVIGLLSLGKDGQTLRLSHMDFWGNRVDKYFPTHQVIPYSEGKDKATDTYIELRLRNSKDKYFYSLKRGTIVDKDVFEAIVGKVISLKTAGR